MQSIYPYVGNSKFSLSERVSSTLSNCQMYIAFTHIFVSSIVLKVFLKTNDSLSVANDKAARTILASSFHFTILRYKFQLDYFQNCKSTTSTFCDVSRTVIVTIETIA